MKVFIFDLDDTIIFHQFGQVNYDNMRIDSTLSNLLDELKYPKIIYTNGTYGHAEEVLKQMRLTNLFTAIYARDTMPAMKPLMESFSFVEKDIRKNINQKNQYYFFDDRLENLVTAKSRGWTTIWVHNDFMNKNISDVVTVVVEYSSKNGIHVYAGNKDLLILIKKNHLAKEVENQRPTRFAKGDKVDAMIVDIDKGKRKIILSNY